MNKKITMVLRILDESENISKEDMKKAIGKPIYDRTVSVTESKLPEKLGVISKVWLDGNKLMAEGVLE